MSFARSLQGSRNLTIFPAAPRAVQHRAVRRLRLGRRRRLHIDRVRRCRRLRRRRLRDLVVRGRLLVRRRPGSLRPVGLKRETEKVVDFPPRLVTSLALPRFPSSPLLSTHNIGELASKQSNIYSCCARSPLSRSGGFEDLFARLIPYFPFCNFDCTRYRGLAYAPVLSRKAYESEKSQARPRLSSCPSRNFLDRASVRGQTCSVVVNCPWSRVVVITIRPRQAAAMVPR